MQKESHARTSSSAYESMFRSLIANLPGIVYRCANDADWTMEFMSDQVLELTGYPASDFIGNAVRSYASVIHRGDLTKVNDAVQAGVTMHCPFAIFYRLIRADGTVCHVYERGRPVCGDNGEMLWLDGIIMDDNPRQQAEESLTRSKRETERKVQDLEQLNKLMIGREVKMSEMKKETDALLKELGRPPRYGKT